MSNKAKRNSIFRFCAPLASKILGCKEELYFCPICGKGFTEESANNGELTLEDVPPRSMGGNGLLLTCNKCNSSAGHKIDFNIKNQQDLRGFFQSIAGNKILSFEKTSCNLIINEGRFPVNIQQKNGIMEIKIINKANDPNKINSLLENWNGAEFNIEKSVKLENRLLKLAFLKSGFLLVTAMLGYTYAFDNRLLRVREQISKPEVALLGTSYWCDLNIDHPFPKRCIISITTPLPLFLVTFDDCAVILPSLFSPLDLYGTLKKEWDQGQIISFSGNMYDWPKKALMVYDTLV